MNGNPVDGERLPEPIRLPVTAQWRLIAIILVALAALGFVGATLKAMFTPKPAAVAPLPPGTFRPTAAQRAQLTLVAAQTGVSAELVRASGSISADGDHSTPILLPFSGQVRDVMVEPGQRVERGQPLLRIASPELVDAHSALLNATSQRASAGEGLRMARANLARQKAIYETAGGAMKDYLQAQADLVTAESAAHQADAALLAAQSHLNLFGGAAGRGKAAATLYRAPVSGIIADRNVAPGQFLSAGNATALMTITNPAHVWLVAQLPESESASIRVGDAVVVTTPALPGRTFRATIDNVAAALDPTTHRLAVRATIANPDGALKPQMFASFVIRRPIAGGAGVAVPAAAVIHEGDSARIWVLGRDGLLYGRPVTIGATEGGFTRILQGLRAGERVVARGALFVNEAGLDQ